MKFRKLEWGPVVGSDNAWWARSPACTIGVLYINYEQDQYWGSWSSTAGPFGTLDAAMDQGQRDHEQWLMQYMDEA